MNQDKTEITSKRPTIVDVAREANVAISTVSRVLNNSGFTSQKTRDRVEKAIEKLEYRKNFLASNLALQRTKSIALLVGDITNPYYSELSLGVEQTATKNGYNVILCNIGRSREREITYVDDLLNRHVDGLIFGESHVGGSFYGKVMKIKVPTVILDRQVQIPNADSIFIDQRVGAYKGTQHLIDLGHRQIAHIEGLRGFLTSQERKEGYLDALRDNKLNVKKQYIIEGFYSAEGGKQAMLKLLNLPKPPTAVFAANDFMAIGAISAVIETGLTIPNNVAIVGFDDIPLAPMMNPSLTTISQPIFQIGALAMQMLVDRLLGKSSQAPQEVVITPSLIVRKSTAK